MAPRATHTGPETTGPETTGGLETTVTAYPDGPLVLRGPARILDEDGQVVPRRPGPVALCRCGRSSLAPFCDGTHKALFRAARRRAARSAAGGGTGPRADTGVDVS